ncbi:leucine-rich repeat-containing protein 49 isoform X3 [Bubalus kerabau]|uniref:leucine-rich repeat-containing protein 49 isoform X3 n=1 Tax=Bubalus bubalis TaxID=89462 RepID=UPI001D103B31|nr:leucine-rich repeat-containing protein 49 isoform X3 [Bubalus bubalis]XP_055392838.1 leucine-rich repeat-containing protein 49 isoform X3 [Bubalus carabanensis]
MIPGKYRSVSGRAASNVNCGLHLVIQTSSLPEKNKVEFKLNRETPSFPGRLLQHDLERNYSSRQGDGRVISPSPHNKSSCISSTTNVRELCGLEMKAATSSLSAFGDASIQTPSKSRIRQGCHSAGPNVSGDHINLVSSSMPSFPILQRSSEEKILYSDRLTLERQKLTVCPIIDGEEHLRLLNFQHNSITQIQNISNLQRLIFLDLYDNQIEEISGLSTLRSLRVLLLGKNRIKKISNLENLKSLDVLDLHGNQRDVDNLPCLQRLFLSFNNISTFESVCCLADSTSLSDITFDGNPIAQESWYKHTILQNMMQLRQLDMKRITEEERRMASIVAKKEEEKKRESHKQSLLKEKKRLTINNVARNWDLQQHRITSIAINQDRRDSDSQDHCQNDGSTVSTFPEEAGSLDSGLSSAFQELSVTDTHLVEVDGDTLSLYGSGALECLDRNWSVQTAGMVTTVSFTFIEFDEIVQVLPKLKIKFPNSLHLKFKETNLVMLQQFNALAQLRRVDQLTIDPQGNPVVNFTLWKYYVLFRLSHFNMQKINGTEVTQNDMIMAERLFGILAHVASSELPQYRLISILGDARKKQFQYLLETKGKKPGIVSEENNDSKRLVGENTNRATLNYTTRDFYTEKLEEIKEKKKFCKMYIEDLVKEATEINMKNEALQKLWPQMFIELVRDAVIEIRNKNSYMKLCLQQITDQK